MRIGGGEVSFLPSFLLREIESQFACQRAKFLKLSPKLRSGPNLGPIFGPTLDQLWSHIRIHPHPLLKCTSFVTKTLSGSSPRERGEGLRAEAESERPNFGTLRTSKSLGAAVSDYDEWQEENEEETSRLG